MKTVLTETLIRAFQQFAEEEMNANGESFPVHERLNDLGLSDETLSEIGLGWLVSEPDETEEEPLKKYTFIFTESRSLTATIKAASEDDAWDLIEDYYFDDHELTSNNDGEWTLLN